MRQFNRSFRLQLGNIQIESVSGALALQTQFSIVRDQRRDPDEAVFSIINLKPENRAELESNEQVSLVFEAGYAENMKQLFAGVVRRAISTKEGPNWVTTVTLGDGESDRIQLASIRKTYKKDTALKTALQDMVRATGLGEGNLQDVVDVARQAALDKFPRSRTFVGPALAELYRQVRSFGFGYTIQDGTFVFYSDTSGTGAGVLLSPETGLVGSPRLDSKGKVQFRALLNADIQPQAVVQLESAQINGRFLVERTNHLGDSRGQDWYVDATARELTSPR